MLDYFSKITIEELCTRDELLAGNYYAEPRLRLKIRFKIITIVCRGKLPSQKYATSNNYY
jgi:hypothetical protein